MLSFRDLRFFDTISLVGQCYAQQSEIRYYGDEEERNRTQGDYERLGSDH